MIYSETNISMLSDGGFISYHTSGGERMRITSGGNVGIGTTSPKSYSSLTVSGQIMGLQGMGIDIGQSYRLNNYYNSGTVTDRTISTGFAASIGLDNSNGGMTFSTSASSVTADNNVSVPERMRITSGGAVAVNATSTNGRLGVRGTTNDSSAFSFEAANSSGNTLFIVRNDGAVFINPFTYNNTVLGGVRNVFIDSTYALGGISSIRASKKNIQEFDSSWIYNLKPVQFNYRKKDEKGNYTEDIYEDLNYGLIAEDTAPIADFLINYNNKKDGTKEMVGIEYMRLITPMLKEIQELKAELNTLKNK
jgi:hypothetical protein